MKTSFYDDLGACIRQRLTVDLVDSFQIITIVVVNQYSISPIWNIFAIKMARPTECSDLFLYSGAF